MNNFNLNLSFGLFAAAVIILAANGILYLVWYRQLEQGKKSAALFAGIIGTGIIAFCAAAASAGLQIDSAISGADGAFSTKEKVFTTIQFFVIAAAIASLATAVNDRQRLVCRFTRRRR